MFYGLETFQPSPTNLYCDNHNAVQIVHNDIFHKRTKYIKLIVTSFVNILSVMNFILSP